MLKNPGILVMKNVKYEGGDKKPDRGLEDLLFILGVLIFHHGVFSYVCFFKMYFPHHSVSPLN